MKSQNLDIEKAKLAAGLPPDKEEIDITEHIQKGESVLILRGGMGLLAEHLSARGCKVYLHEEDRLCFSYRRNILTNGSDVVQWNVPIDTIVFNKPYFDHIIVRTNDDLTISKNGAKKTIVNLYVMEIINVEHNSEKSSDESKTEGNS